MRRVGCGNFVTFLGKRYRAGDPRFLLWSCERERGRADARWAERWRKFLRAARAGFRADFAPKPENY